MSVDLAALLDRPIAFHRSLVKPAGSIYAALFLGQAIYWSRRTSDEDGWFYKTAVEWTEETSLSTDQQATARALLRAGGLIQEVKKGIPGKLYYRVDFAALLVALSSTEGAWVELSLGRSPKLGSEDPRNLFETFPETLSESETTTETTAEKKKEGSAQPRSKQEPLPNIPPELDTRAFREAWELRLAERKEKGAKGRMHPTQVFSQFEDLAKLAKTRGIAAAVAAVKRSTSGGYQGVVFKEDFTCKEIGGKRPTPGIPAHGEDSHQRIALDFQGNLHPGWCFLRDPATGAQSTCRLDNLRPGDVPLDDDFKEMVR